MASVASETDNRPVVNPWGQIDRVKIRDCPGQLEATVCVLLPVVGKSV